MLALVINAAFLVVEAVGGVLSGSLALLADAGHMAIDVAALALAATAAYLAGLAPTGRRTFGLLRAEVIGAFINGGGLVLIVGAVLFEAIRRLGSPSGVNAPLMLIIGAIGLAANAVSALVLLGRHTSNINVRGAFLHLVSDTLGSVGVVVGAIIILLGGSLAADPIVSIFIAVIIAVSTIGLMRDTLGMLIQATPAHIDYREVMHALQENEHVELVHDLHIYNIASNIPILTAHIRLHPACSESGHWQQCLLEAQEMLRRRFGIVHTTLQLEPPGYRRDERVV